MIKNTSNRLVALPTFHFSFSFAGKIWQMAQDRVRAELIIELRDTAGHEQVFYVLDLEQGSLSAGFDIPSADWWTTLHRASFPWIFLEHYTDPEDPGKKDLLMYNRASDQVQRSGQFQLMEILEDRLIGHDPEHSLEKKEINLDLKPNETEVKTVYPAYFAPGSESHALVMQFVEAGADELGCEYFEGDEYIIICYYQRLGTKYLRKLLVLKGETELYSGLVDSNLEGYASGGFFIVNNLLVFVENGNQINAIKL